MRFISRMQFVDNRPRRFSRRRSGTCHDTASKSGALAASAKGGTSGNGRQTALSMKTQAAPNLPSLDQGERRTHFDEAEMPRDLPQYR